MLLASGAAPTIAGRMQALAEVVPLGVIELSHFLASIAGLLLLLVAWGLRRRLDGAYLATLAILAAGIVLSLLRGLHVEQAAILALTLLALAPCRRAFYRKTALLTERFSSGWLLAVAAVLLGMLWLGFFSHRHVEYSNDLWWRFVVEEDAPRFLRAAAGTLILFLIVGAAQLLRASRRPAPAPHPDEVARARAVIAATPDAPVIANLALLGDKHFLFSESGRSFIMFGVRGGSWIAMGEPVGPPEERHEILWQFRELCDRHGAWPAFYQITPESLPQFLELGLTFQKLGEEALVPLDRFSIEGLKSTELALHAPAPAARRLPVRDRAGRGRAGHPGHARRDLGGMAGFQERAREGLLARSLRARLHAQLPDRGGARRRADRRVRQRLGERRAGASCRSI